MFPPRFHTRLLLAGLFLCSTWPGGARADSIGFNAIGTLAGGMAPGDSAGAPGANAANWNNLNSNQATAGGVIAGAIAAGGVVDDSGAVLATVDVSWTGNGVATAAGAGTNDAKMWSSEWDLFGGTPDMAITVNNIPYPVYDVYFYVDDASNTNVRGGDVDANGVLESITMFNATTNGYTEVDSKFTWNAATTGVGSYLRLEGVTGSSLLLQMEAKNTSTPRLRMSGFQIVGINTSLPVVTNLAATLVGMDSASANGDLLNNGDGADSAAVTLYWGTADGGTDPLAWGGSVMVGPFTQPESFSTVLGGLVANTTYYYRAFASNSAGDSWAPASESFKTLPPLEFPEVENRAATAVGLNAATANGELLRNGIGADSAAITIYWGPTDGGTDALAWGNNTPAGALTSPGTFSAPLTGLSVATTYYYRAFARNSVADDWAPTSESFTTLRPSLDTISMNFVQASDGAGLMAPTDVAGVVPVANWNTAVMANANGATGFPLIDDGGAASGATIDWQNAPTATAWSVVLTGTGSAGDLLMMTGYLDQTGDGLGQLHTITVNNIPYGNYDVYLYHSSAGGPNRTARYQANGIDLYTRNLDPAGTFNGFIPAQYDNLAAAALAAGNPAGNYVLWEGLSGTLQIEAQGIGDAEGGSGGNTRRAPIQGIQIVAASPAKPFAITAITYDSATGKVTVTWNSEPGVVYGVDSSETILPSEQPGGWMELADPVATEATTSYEHTLPDPAPPNLFYRIRKVGN